MRNTDVARGVVDRLRSLPIRRSAPLVGAVVGDSVSNAVAATTTVVSRVILGLRPEAGVVGVRRAAALAVAFA